jgi:hypothetical protein
MTSAEIINSPSTLFTAAIKTATNIGEKQDGKITNIDHVAPSSTNI